MRAAAGPHSAIARPCSTLCGETSKTCLPLGPGQLADYRLRSAARTKAHTEHARIDWWTTGGMCHRGSRQPGAARRQSSREHHAGSGPRAAGQNVGVLWQFLGSNEREGPCLRRAVNTLRLGVREQGMAGVGECDGQPVAWRFGTSSPTALTVNITTWGGQVCAWCQTTGHKTHSALGPAHQRAGIELKRLKMMRLSPELFQFKS